MIQRHLREIASDLIARESDEQKLAAYREMQKHAGWETHKAILLTLFQQMGNDLFSKGFTEKSAEDKDLTQRVYYELQHIIKFLLNPLEEAKGQIQIQGHNRKMAQYTRGKDK